MSSCNPDSAIVEPLGLVEMSLSICFVLVVDGREAFDLQIDRSKIRKDLKLRGTAMPTSLPPPDALRAVLSLAISLCLCLIIWYT